jgi:hypothetical protein
MISGLTPLILGAAEAEERAMDEVELRQAKLAEIRNRKDQE